MRFLIAFDGPAMDLYNGAVAWRGCIRRALSPKTVPDFLPLFAPEHVPSLLTGERQAVTNETTPGYTLHCQPSTIGRQHQWLHVRLVGKCASYAAALVHAVDAQTASGVGQEHLRYRLVTVQVSTSIGTWTDIADLGGLGKLNQLATKPHIDREQPIGDVSLHFYSRLQIISGGVEQPNPPAFDLLMKYLIQRILRLVRWHGSSADTKAVQNYAAQALAVATKCQFDGCQIRGIPTFRVAGPLSGLLPFLLLGQDVGIGANTTIGWGRYTLVTPDLM